MSQLVHNEEQLTFIALPWEESYPIITWLDSIEPRTRGQFRALTRMMDKAYIESFDYRGRIAAIPTSPHGLVRLLVTPPGDPAPPQVIYATRREALVLLACAGRPCSELERLAEQIVARWEARADGDDEAEVAA